MDDFSTDDGIASRTGELNQGVRNAYSELAATAKTFARDDTVEHADRVSLLAIARNLFVTGVRQTMAHQPLMLGTESTVSDTDAQLMGAIEMVSAEQGKSHDEVANWLTSLMVPMHGKGRRLVGSITLAASRICSGDLPVSTSALGKLEIEDKYTESERKLREARDEITTLQAASPDAALQAQVDALTVERDNAVADLATRTSELATATATLTTRTDELTTANTDLTTRTGERDAARAIADDLKVNSKKSRLNRNHKEYDPSKLHANTQAFLNA
jgi:hypothetical protein